MLDNRCRSSRLRLIYFGESLVFFLRQQKIEWDEERILPFTKDISESSDGVV